ncbi:MAG: ATP-binding protein [Pedobacter sp.]|nr:ATP-binding protein [Pedobacter sp.]MDQ8053218.1 ATP-binding protein [Pedobacter sp.]
MAIIEHGFELDKALNISFVYDVDKKNLDYIDQSLLDLIGQHRAQLTYNAVMALLHPEELSYVRKKLQQLHDGHFSGSICFRLNAPDGERWMRLTPFVFQTANTKYIAGNADDVTAEFNNRYAIEKYANKKNSTLNIIAHDLRGPLGIARSISGVLAKKLDDQVAVDQIGYVSTILKQSIDMITGLVEREFTDTVHVELVKKRMDIVAKTKEYVEEYVIAANTLKRKFSFSPSSNEIYLELDEAKVMQIYNNLFTNALKFTKEGDRIELVITDQKDSVLIRFSDTGIGIPAQSLPILFDKFTDARRSGLNGEPSVGVGLSIVKTIVDWHDGHIQVESVEGKGTTFLIEIPKKHSD